MPMLKTEQTGSKRVEVRCTKIVSEENDHDFMYIIRGHWPSNETAIDFDRKTCCHLYVQRRHVC